VPVHVVPTSVPPIADFSTERSKARRGYRREPQTSTVLAMATSYELCSLMGADQFAGPTLGRQVLSCV
jgi:hypothetical protein